MMFKMASEQTAEVGIPPWAIIVIILFLIVLAFALFNADKMISFIKGVVSSLVLQANKILSVGILGG